MPRPVQRSRWAAGAARARDYGPEAYRRWLHAARVLAADPTGWHSGAQAAQRRRETRAGRRAET